MGELGFCLKLSNPRGCLLSTLLHWHPAGMEIAQARGDKQWGQWGGRRWFPRSRKAKHKRSSTGGSGVGERGVYIEGSSLCTSVVGLGSPLPGHLFLLMNGVNWGVGGCSPLPHTLPISHEGEKTWWPCPSLGSTPNSPVATSWRRVTKRGLALMPS